MGASVHDTQRKVKGMPDLCLWASCTGDIMVAYPAPICMRAHMQSWPPPVHYDEGRKYPVL
jgi:hypothetical protein